MRTGFLHWVDFDRLLRLATLAIASAIGLAVFGRFDWRLDLFSHWRLHYMVLGGMLLPLLLFRRHYRYALLAVLIVFANTTGLRSAAPAIAAATPDAGMQPGTHHLRLAHFNVLVSNTAYGRTLAWLHQANPDIVILIEFTEAWSKAMESLKAELPYRVEAPYNEGSGVALYSRYPLHDSARYDVGNPSKAAITAVVAVDGKELTVIAAHPWPPTSAVKAREHDQYLAFILSLVRKANGPLVISGDLNTTPWSYAYRDFSDAAGFTGRHFLPTWPAGFGFLGIPIDHVLGKSARIEALTVGPRLGSDHLPLLADISF